MRIFFLVLASLCAGCAATSHKPKLIFDENFEGTELNKDLWTFDLGDGCPQICGWGNEESQIYTRNNHKVADGFLTITARKEDSIFTSTRIKTKEKFEFQYGTIEIRAKLPRGKGIWPAFWMLGSNIDEVGWPTSGEIDIMEFAGKDPELVHTTIHNQSGHGTSAHTEVSIIENITEGFHTFKAVWTEQKIEFFIDNQKVYSYIPQEKTVESWPFDQPFFVLINMAVGGHFGGLEIDQSIFPQEYVIDYVKIWQ